MTALNMIGLNCKGMNKWGEWEALMREAKLERVNVLTLQELNVRPDMVDQFKRRASSLDFDACISCSDSAACRGGTGVLVRRGFAAAPPEAVVDSTRVTRAVTRWVLGGGALPAPEAEQSTDREVGNVEVWCEFVFGGGV